MHLGSYIGSTENDIRVRKALSWQALHSLKKVWKSSMNKELKKSLFLATVEATLLHVYGCEARTLHALTTKEQNSLDGCYTRMLRMAKNVSWREKVRNEVLYGNLPRVKTQSGKEDSD